MNEKLEKIKKLLKKYGQEHLLLKYDEMNDEQKEYLLNQIEDIDFDLMKNLYEKASKPVDFEEVTIEPIEHVDKSKLTNAERERYEKLGIEAIKYNKFACVTMAGGQGTRLGHNGPKGTFLLDVKPEPKYLFQIIVEDLLRAKEDYGVYLNWYIMTSNENTKMTTDFLEEHNYFGYPTDHVKIFVQGDLPLLDEQGKLIVNKDYEIKVASDGNGCIYKSMADEGVIDDMKAKGIEWVFVGSVDNALVKNVDPILIGLTKIEGNEIGSKSIAKAYPQERVGVFCKKNGHPAVIEYSEIPEEMTEEVDEDGELLYGEANIMNHVYTLDAIEKISKEELPYHSAHKKADMTMVDGTVIKATEPNAYKYEAFIFDGFKFFNNMTLVRGVRENEFAPVKNAEGKDSPATAVELYNNYWKL